jgi:hypothetical protein
MDIYVKNWHIFFQSLYLIHMFDQMFNKTNFEQFGVGVWSP